MCPVVNTVDVVADRERLERQHPVQREVALPEPARGGAHEPVLRFPGGEVEVLAVLIVETANHVRISREGPALRRRDDRMLMFGVWLIGLLAVRGLGVSMLMPRGSFLRDDRCDEQADEDKD